MTTYKAIATPFIIAIPLLHTCLVTLSVDPLRHLVMSAWEFLWNNEYNA